MNDRSSLSCTDERRRRLTRASALNGIDYVEVLTEDQRSLRLHLFKEAPEQFLPVNAVIEGGRKVKVVHAEPGEESLLVRVQAAGDFSPYTIRLVEAEDDRPTDRPLHGFDPRYAQSEFSFKVDCPSDLDCVSDLRCPPERRQEPDIDYLAKDYASFRRLILDRLKLIMPEWRETHIPDIGITLVEILAYVGDYLSYYQDAVATEAYLGTARLRKSVRRHARLVDYHMHEGCNARALICIETSENFDLSFGEFYFATGDAQTLGVEGAEIFAADIASVPDHLYLVFEPVAQGNSESLTLHRMHNKIRFYTWGDEECCLVTGATSATLIDARLDSADSESTDSETTYVKITHAKSSDSDRPRVLHLAAGDYLILQEVLGPHTGELADADPSRRHAVRLTSVERREDPLNGIPLLEVRWGQEDALPFPLCISAIGRAPECELLHDVSVACGNVILVEHGRPSSQIFDPVPPAQDQPSECCGEGQPMDEISIPARFNPSLNGGPLTYHVPLPGHTSAKTILSQDPRKALPAIALFPLDDDRAPIKGAVPWTPRGDLLHSDATDHHFVVEMDDDGIAHLRFGDGELGRRPAVGVRLEARYLAGNGVAGNVGRESIVRIVRRVTRPSGQVLSVTNPLPAAGGLDPEALADVRLFASGSVRKNRLRAVTANDYAELAQEDPRIQRAAAELRWTGSWYEARVNVDPIGSEQPSAGVLKAIKGRLYRNRRIGHDLAVVKARYVPLHIEMHVCVLPHYLKAHVRAALQDTFSSRILANGRRGFFHPDNLSFGGEITESALLAAAQSVDGVQSAELVRLDRLGEETEEAVRRPELILSPQEIARLDSDLSHPENGKFILTVDGGR